ncbi:hypothetical protein BDV93DRAFT_519194 [Ceratobasidium sp. AG-I]|nr:hypothetical protein BDV93DRAFT_519194 [Ceratobasidium sp. AG-I]
MTQPPFSPLSTRTFHSLLLASVETTVVGQYHNALMRATIPYLADSVALCHFSTTTNIVTLHERTGSHHMVCFSEPRSGFDWQTAAWPDFIG